MEQLPWIPGISPGDKLKAIIVLLICFYWIKFEIKPRTALARRLLYANDTTQIKRNVVESMFIFSKKELFNKKYSKITKSTPTKTRGSRSVKIKKSNSNVKNKIDQLKSIAAIGDISQWQTISN